MPTLVANGLHWDVVPDPTLHAAPDANAKTAIATSVGIDPMIWPPDALQPREDGWYALRECFLHTQGQVFHHLHYGGRDWYAPVGLFQWDYHWWTGQWS